MKFVVTGISGVQLREHVPLRLVAREQRVGREALPVERLRRVDRRGCPAGRLDLRPAPVALSPERRSPGLVQRLELAVPRAEPDTEVLRRDRAVAGGHVQPYSLPDVPHRQRRVASVAAGELLGDPDARLAVDRRARAVVAPAAELEPYPLRGDGKDLRVLAHEPRGRSGGRGRQVDARCRSTRAGRCTRSSQPKS